MCACINGKDKIIPIGYVLPTYPLHKISRVLGLIQGTPMPCYFPLLYRSNFPYPTQNWLRVMHMMAEIDVTYPEIIVNGVH